ncbi:DUF3549 family protein [Solemya velum gill symbiont]|uniref:DUF3549 family protein n=1 Tax=Solemya velum gill symbiont TaxID=2340 RepID=UPI00099774CA|nr:DUF3549 family protein [Solemya velum gill symbiont]OOY52063.1 hypothetical protein BOV97_06735 [Solemya velum gill symbiont]OOY56165.1 hypothetical protein BOV99_05740 [Solemya velum gill symbiont]OOY57408.1 hypothetical protein BOW00_05540 [Solemya velum gill symbiont]OOY60289.1 hypothetical protein BOW02_06090 [Solemya velum gill symbiont]OOY62440.1 hypothetical protein BOW04_06455 [Solemya velum gill symbiont]
MSDTPKPDQFSTLTELLEATGSKLRLYDMGRRIQRVSRLQFIKFERYEIAWPAPLARHAWLALLQTGSANDEPVIWFLKLPLDEQGKLVQAARDYFVQRLAEVWALNKTQESNIPDALKDNPFVFKPREERMAAFHAKVSVDLKQPVSNSHAHAKEYFSGEAGWEQWQFVGYQGIADVAARFAENNNTSLITKAVPQLPAEPLTALCHCLENEEIPLPIAKALLERLQHTMDSGQPDIALVTALIRGISGTVSRTTLASMFERVMQQTAAQHVDVLTAVAGRAWNLLTDEEMAVTYLSRLANNSAGQEVFNAVMRDLLAIPALRNHLLSAAKNADIEQQMQIFQKSLREERKPDTSAT